MRGDNQTPVTERGMSVHSSQTPPPSLNLASPPPYPPLLPPGHLVLSHEEAKMDHGAGCHSVRLSLSVSQNAFQGLREYQLVQFITA